MAALKDAIVDMGINGVWTNITGDLAKQPITLKHGLQDEADHSSPAQCDLRLINILGKYSPRNAEGPYYELFGRNTPLRVSLANTGIDDGPTFDKYSEFILSSGSGPMTWSHPTTSLFVRGVLVFVVQDLGTTDEVQSVTYGGVALAEIPGSPFFHTTGAEDATIYAFFLGDNIPPGEQIIVVNHTTTSVKAAAAYTVTSNATKTIVHSTATLDSGGVANPSVNITTTKKTFTAAALHSGQDSFASITPGTGYTRDGTGFDFGLANADYERRTVSPIVAGTYAVSWTATSDEAGIFAVSIADADLYPRFHGEIAELPQEWTRVNPAVTGCSVSGIPFNDAGVPLVANGITRRLNQGPTPLKSALERFVSSSTTGEVPDQPNAFAYWPLNDLSRATLGEPVVGDHRFNLRRKGSSMVKPGQGELAPWISNCVQIGQAASTNVYLDAVVDMPVSLGVPDYTIDWVLRYGDEKPDVASMSAYDNDGNLILRVRYVQSTNTVEVRLRTGGENSTETVNSSFTDPTTFDGDMHAWRFIVSQNGANVNYQLNRDDVIAIHTGSVASTTQTGLGRVRITGGTGSNQGAIVVWGHVAVWATTDVHFAPSGYFEAMNGLNGEPAADRILRLCTEESILCRIDNPALVTSPCGPQYEETFLEVLADAELTDAGILYEPREFIGLAYRSRASLQNQQFATTLTYQTQCGMEVSTTDDDQRTRNLVKIERRDGSSKTVEQKTGRLSTSPPPTGVGVYDEQLTVNLPGDGKPIEDYAGWELHMGTIDEPRFPAVRVVIGSHIGLCSVTSIPALLGLDVGDRFGITNLPSWILSDDADQLMLGALETIGTGVHETTFNCAPASPFNVLLYEPAVTGTGGTSVNKLDTDGSIVAADATSTATTLQVATTRGPPWTTDDPEFPFDVRVSGERIRVTDIVPAATQTMQAGAVSHGDNANLTPALPASVQLGDLLLILAAIRTGSGTVNVPAGYILLAQNGDHFRLMGKIAGSSESAPSVTFSGGALGDTTSAQVARFRGGLWYDINKAVVAFRARSPGTVQDIAFKDINAELPMSLIILCAWKQDDWTTVTDPTPGNTVIGSNPTLTGNDQGTYWSFRQPTTAPDQTARDVLTITGGAAAIAKSVIVILHEDRQQFAVTRSINNVQKPQVTGRPVSLWAPRAYGL